jgi:hypothetical protein
MEGGVAQVRKRRLFWRGFLIVILLVVANFLAASLADRMLRNRDQFFETIVAGADLAYKPWKKGESSTYVECHWHRVLLVYWGRTCFRRDGSSHPEFYGNQNFVQLYYWSPLALSMLWASDFHFDVPGAETILYVSRQNQILKDLRND